MRTLEDLLKVREETRKAMQARDAGQTTKIRVATGTCGIASGAADVVDAIVDELQKRGISNVAVAQSGCKGLCEQEPTVDIIKPGRSTVTYGYVTPDRARQIIAEHVVNDHITGEWVVATEKK